MGEDQEFKLTRHSPAVRVASSVAIVAAFIVVAILAGFPIWMGTVLAVLGSAALLEFLVLIAYRATLRPTGEIDFRSVLRHWSTSAQRISEIAPRELLFAEGGLLRITFEGGGVFAEHSDGTSRLIQAIHTMNPSIRLVDLAAS